MLELKRKNSFWHLYGMVFLAWGFYILMLIFGVQTIALLPIIVIIVFSILIIISHWSSTIEVNFYSDSLVSKHYLTSHQVNFEYSKIESVEQFWGRVDGVRLIFKFYDEYNNIYSFTIFKPDSELIDFVNKNIVKIKGRI